MNNCVTKLRLGELGNKLIDLSEDEDKASIALRIYQSDLKETMDTQILSLSKIQQFIAFFLDSFIDDYFYNLAGDYPYKEEFEDTFKDIWRDIFKNIGNSLIKISKNIEKNNYGECCEACSSIVSLYLEKINYLNEILMEENN